ncbi:MAG: DotI/IcmL/TraM family protein [Alphaproteobacteria bacterium]|nr:DotI/IcmL/TraM family protein [Alphaproteobacteria bacterium]
MPVKDAIATVLNRNAFYRDGYRMLLRISLIQLAVIGILVLAIAGLALTMKPKMVYFATTSDGRIINIVPLDAPYLSPAQVIAWSASTAQNVMRFGYSDYRARLQQVEPDFTQIGWNSFNKALKDAGFIAAVQARKLVVSMDINAAPEIQNATVRNGVYTWYVQFPVTIKFDGDQPPQPISTTLRLQIVRVSTLQNPDGVSIEQWVLLNNAGGGQ